MAFFHQFLFSTSHETFWLSSVLPSNKTKKSRVLKTWLNFVSWDWWVISCRNWFINACSSYERPWHNRKKVNHPGCMSLIDQQMGAYGQHKGLTGNAIQLFQLLPIDICCSDLSSLLCKSLKSREKVIPKLFHNVYTLKENLQSWYKENTDRHCVYSETHYTCFVIKVLYYQKAL